MLKNLHGSINAPKVGIVRDLAPDIRELKHWHLSMDSKEGKYLLEAFREPLITLPGDWLPSSKMARPRDINGAGECSRDTKLKANYRLLNYEWWRFSSSDISQHVMSADRIIMRLLHINNHQWRQSKCMYVLSIQTEKTSDHDLKGMKAFTEDVHHFVR